MKQYGLRNNQTGVIEPTQMPEGGVPENIVVPDGYALMERLVPPPDPLMGLGKSDDQKFMSFGDEPTIWTEHIHAEPTPLSTLRAMLEDAIDLIDDMDGGE